MRKILLYALSVVFVGLFFFGAAHVLKDDAPKYRHKVTLQEIAEWRNNYEGNAPSGSFSVQEVQLLINQEGALNFVITPVNVAGKDSYALTVYDSYGKEIGYGLELMLDCPPMCPSEMAQQ